MMEARAVNNLLSYYPRKSEVDVTIKFCQKQSFADIFQNRCYSKFRKFHRQAPVLESLFHKV